MNNIVLAQYYANKVCKSCASLAGFVALLSGRCNRFCCNLQPCMLHVASCIAAVIGVWILLKYVYNVYTKNEDGAKIIMVKKIAVQ